MQHYYVYTFKFFPFLAMLAVHFMFILLACFLIKPLPGYFAVLLHYKVINSREYLCHVYKLEHIKHSDNTFKSHEVA